MKKLTQCFILILLAVFSAQCSDDYNDSDTEAPQLTVTDADGNIYNTITIGNQTWMLENLKTTKYNDGTPITAYTFATHGNNWLNFNTPEALYQWANTSDLNNVFDEELPFDYYGAMYNHLAIESGKLAPDGWRIPTVQDFVELQNYIANNGNSGNEATALKSKLGWLSSSGNGTDLYNFKGLPNGYVNTLGGPTASELISTWATIDFNSVDQTRKMVSLFDEATILYIDNSIKIGAAIRCIKE
ncbi:FISUMP domain-containing protein [uncultured Psychroserpens sp.]|uniref:FISUMP domain-containing protein n=1 Tax=uncultured Psychroserpens sp. TaxID=255436 RepID=UPI00262EA909|nr:FISUMP domain-containing protein [uncultured Psychroserpens sp.]